MKMAEWRRREADGRRGEREKGTGTGGGGGGLSTGHSLSTWGGSKAPMLRSPGYITNNNPPTRGRPSASTTRNAASPSSNRGGSMVSPIPMHYIVSFRPPTHAGTIQITPCSNYKEFWDIDIPSAHPRGEDPEHPRSEVQSCHDPGEREVLERSLARLVLRRSQGKHESDESRRLCLVHDAVVPWWWFWRHLTQGKGESCVLV